MDTPSPILGIDYGTKRVGTAISDIYQRFASPYKLIPNNGNVCEQILDIIKEKHIKTIVIGLPMGQSGNKTQMSDTIKTFGTEVTEKAQRAKLSVTIVYINEALTSYQAYDNLLLRGATHQKIKGKLDTEAARIILQEYLDDL